MESQLRTEEGTLQVLVRYIEQLDRVGLINAENTRYLEARNLRTGGMPNDGDASSTDIHGTEFARAPSRAATSSEDDSDSGQSSLGGGPFCRTCQNILYENGELPNEWGGLRAREEVRPGGDGIFSNIFWCTRCGAEYAGNVHQVSLWSGEDSEDTGRPAGSLLEAAGLYPVGPAWNREDDDRSSLGWSSVFGSHH